jgi:hypothetical protein
MSRAAVTRLKPTWQDFSAWNFDIGGFTSVMFVVSNTKFKLACFCKSICCLTGVDRNTYPDASRRFGTTKSAPTLLELWPKPILFWWGRWQPCVAVAYGSQLSCESMGAADNNLLASDARLRYRSLDAYPKIGSVTQPLIIELCTDRPPFFFSALAYTIFCYAYSIVNNNAKKTPSLVWKSSLVV